MICDHLYIPLKPASAIQILIYLCTLPCCQVPAALLKIGWRWKQSTGRRSSNESDWLQQINSSPTNSHQARCSTGKMGDFLETTSFIAGNACTLISNKCHWFHTFFQAVLPSKVHGAHLGPTGAHLGPVGPRWAPCGPHEPCYLGSLYS